ATNKGELVIDVDDPAIEVVVYQGAARLVDRTTDRTFELKAGDGEVEFYDPATGAGAVTKRFTLTRNGKGRVSATMKEIADRRKPVGPKKDPPPGPAGTDPDRRAAEWVLGVGGRVGIRQGETARELGPKDPLPPGPFLVRWVILVGARPVT